MIESLTSGYRWIDVAIVFLYLAALVGIGSYFSRRQHSLDDFIRGGRKFGWITIGVSLVAALNSGIDYVQAPALVYATGIILVTSCLSWIPLYPWVSRVTLPFYQRLDVYSAYEYLELRFGVVVRVVAAGIFILWRVGWMGAAIYVPCLAVKAATGGQIEIAWMVVPLGIIVTLYTMLGGMRAVVWTDVMQFAVMFAGIAVTFGVIVTHLPGGVSDVFRVAVEHGKLDPFGTMQPGVRGFFTTELTFWGVVLLVTLSRAAAFTVDQIAIQRFQASHSLAEARRSYLLNAATDTIWMTVLALIGLALFAYYRSHALPDGLQNDRILPHFMWAHFPAGLTGLVIAAIFAASLSSVDSALNSTSSIVMVDFYNRLVLGRRRPAQDLPADEQARQLKISRGANLALGGLMILLGANIERMGEIYQACNKILGAFFGPLFGVFVLGLFSRRAHSAGVVIGVLCGLGASCFASFFSVLPWLQSLSGAVFGPAFVAFFKELSWQWPSPIGITVTLTVGFGASALLRGPARREPPLTFAEVMKRPVAATPGSALVDLKQ
jgi:SSS family solute:Na+ symporter